MVNSAANFGQWINEPRVQDAVISVLERAEQPILLREVAAEAQVPISSANRVLGRLHGRGFVTRYKLPVQGHPRRYGHKPCILCRAQRRLFVYSWVASALEG